MADKNEYVDRISKLLDAIILCDLIKLKVAGTPISAPLINAITKRLESGGVGSAMEPGSVDQQILDELVEADVDVSVLCKIPHVDMEGDDAATA